MTSSEIRQSFLDFFREKQHTIVPSSSLLPDAPNLLFTNAGMNQFVPIFLGQTPCPYTPARAADTQKCIRAGGKHNDLEDVGFDTYHHTFFEMLGNWSFGDYFKKEAIAWAWELVVGRWKFPASRIYATVYCPYIDMARWSEEIEEIIATATLHVDVDDINSAPPGSGPIDTTDIVAGVHWARIFLDAKLDPRVHIVPGNKKDNFWMMGDTGPCGPCSELHVDLRPGPPDVSANLAFQTEGRALVNSGDARCIEIWNLVFIQFNANPDGTYVELPAKHVDTGMGFERVASMIQGTKGFTDFSQSEKISNYETDIFRPIFDVLEILTEKKYGSTLPASAQNLSEQEKIDVAFRVIADHIRTLSFSIADGIQPSNEGRGYVLRRILRRAVRYGRNLGLREPFLGKLVDVLGATMGHIFPEVVGKADHIKKTLTQEEESFLRTLERGIELFELIFSTKKRIAGVAQAIREIPNESSGAMVKITNLFHGAHEMPGDRELIKKCLAQEEWDFFSDGEMLSRQHFNAGWGGQEALKKWKKDAMQAFIQLHLISGPAAFLLSDTYGFPLDLTELMARERGLAVNVTEFNRLMDEQRARGKAAQKKDVITVAIKEVLDQETTEQDISRTEMETFVSMVSYENENQLYVVPEKTPFYVEMGGQVGDTGEISFGLEKFPVTTAVRRAGAIFHLVEHTSPLPDTTHAKITLLVDKPRRARIEAHHSGTHLMNWALRKVLGNTITQKGSYVGPDRLRFDFSHGTALTPAELAEVEKLVNDKINEDVPVRWEERPYTEVKGDPSVLQFFGDKYGDVVRVVSIGDFSKELCGGTHVRNSGKIGYFKILSEGAIAAGIRRIEAASGAGLIEHVREHLPKQHEIHTALRSRKTDIVPMSEYFGEETPEAFWKHWEARDAFLRQAAADVAQHEKDEAKRQEAGFQKRAAADAPVLIAFARTAGDIPFLAHSMVEATAAYLPVLADALKTRWQGVAVLAAIDKGKVALLCAVSPDYTKKIQAGKIIQAIAPLVGGKGGGRPELAQGGGTNPDGIPAALAKAEEMLRTVST
jgi:alanyl-tRNA synthetase